MIPVRNVSSWLLEVNQPLTLEYAVDIEAGDADTKMEGTASPCVTEGEGRRHHEDVWADRVGIRLATVFLPKCDDYVSTSEMCLEVLTSKSMNAMILHLTPEVREAALDLKALRRKIKEAGERAWEWFPAEANARQRMLCLSFEQTGDQEALSSRQTPPPKPGEGFLKLAGTKAS